MMIGKFRRAQNGRLEGVIETLSGEIGAVFVPAPKGAAYNVLTDSGCELGAAWAKTSKDDKAYHSVKLDSPFLPKALNCALFSSTQNPNEFHLVWDRPEPKTA